jgi:hypothetical protein
MFKKFPWGNIVISSKGQCTGPDVKLWKQFLRSNYWTSGFFGKPFGPEPLAPPGPEVPKVVEKRVVSTWFNKNPAHLLEKASEDAGCFMNIFDTTI